MTTELEARALVARRLKEIRELRNLSKKELGRRARVDAAYIAHIEAGRRSPSIDVMCRLADSLEMPLQWWFIVEQIP